MGSFLKTKSGRYTWLQVLCLVLATAGYLLGNMLAALVMLTLATIFGVLGMMLRVKQAQQMGGIPKRDRQQRR